ncbi:uncharacterized protein ATNIH1004_003098 [Aspergillus tanneri]|uniref:Uncharacterized protein n=1 Tax=Aspergillus tanneri TaxID=1220188 RepID=A0A5M9MTG7_9EURO|nr:uncharacterized protein ATNIH1004_003098 [Aspergillus tanneri]KAA8650412.1 hypothetical protein ATNIH1004_003098 [Aspergillus tanneri]
MSKLYAAPLIEELKTVGEFAASFHLASAIQINTEASKFAYDAAYSVEATKAAIHSIGQLQILLGPPFGSKTYLASLANVFVRAG